MTETFYEKPILNSPYKEPARHHALDGSGQPTDQPPVFGRRKSEQITPVPKPRKKKNRKESGQQASLDLSSSDGISSEDQEYTTTIINEIRSHVGSWRTIPSANDWGVTPATARLLQYWRHHEFQGVRPFFCQVEAVETIIWLTEVARKHKTYKKFWDHIQGANEQANPNLIRLAMKMATGAGKTTVMAMIMAWQSINSVRSPTSNLFTRGFLLVTPGITIKDRLRVLLPNDPDMLNSFFRLYFPALAILAATCVSVPAGAESLKLGCYPKQDVASFLKNNRQSQLDQFYRVSYEGRKKTTLTAEHNGEGYVIGGIGYVIESNDQEACVMSKIRVLHLGPNGLEGSKIFTKSTPESVDKECKAAIQAGRELCDTYDSMIAKGLKHGEKIILQGIGYYADKDGTEKEGSILETIQIESTAKGDGVILFSNIPSGATYPVGLINRSAIID